MIGGMLEWLIYAAIGSLILAIYQYIKRQKYRKVRPEGWYLRDDAWNRHKSYGKKKEYPITVVSLIDYLSHLTTADGEPIDWEVVDFQTVTHNNFQMEETLVTAVQVRERRTGRFLNKLYFVNESRETTTAVPEGFVYHNELVSAPEGYAPAASPVVQPVVQPAVSPAAQPAVYPAASAAPVTPDSQLFIPVDDDDLEETVMMPDLDTSLMVPEIDLEETLTMDGEEDLEKTVMMIETPDDPGSAFISFRSSGK